MKFKEAKELAQGHRVVGDRAENKSIIHKAWIAAQDALFTKHMTFNKSFSLNLKFLSQKMKISRELSKKAEETRLSHC